MSKWQRWGPCAISIPRDSSKETLVEPLRSFLRLGGAWGSIVAQKSPKSYFSAWLVCRSRSMGLSFHPLRLGPPIAKGIDYPPRLVYSSSARLSFPRTPLSSVETWLPLAGTPLSRMDPLSLRTSIPGIIFYWLGSLGVHGDSPSLLCRHAYILLGRLCRSLRASPFHSLGLEPHRKRNPPACLLPFRNLAFTG